MPETEEERPNHIGLVDERVFTLVYNTRAGSIGQTYLQTNQPESVNELAMAGWGIPDTIIFHDGNPTVWYFTDKNGVLKRKHSRRLQSQEIYDNFVNNPFQFHSAWRSERPVDVVASFTPSTYNPQHPLMAPMHLTAAELHEFLIHEKHPAKRGSGILQKFVCPKEKCNEMMRCDWSIHATFIERRTNLLKLDDNKKLKASRLVTFEPGADDSLVVSTSLGEGYLHNFINKIMNQVSLHISRVSAFGFPFRMTAYLKQDTNSRLWFLFCDHLQFAPRLEPRQAVEIERAMASRIQKNTLDTIIRQRAVKRKQDAHIRAQYSLDGVKRGVLDKPDQTMEKLNLHTTVNYKKRTCHLCGKDILEKNKRVVIPARHLLAYVLVFQASVRPDVSCPPPTPLELYMLLRIYMRIASGTIEDGTEDFEERLNKQLRQSHILTANASLCSPCSQDVLRVQSPGLDNFFAQLYQRVRADFIALGPAIPPHRETFEMWKRKKDGLIRASSNDHNSLFFMLAPTNPNKPVVFRPHLTHTSGTGDELINALTADDKSSVLNEIPEASVGSARDGALPKLPSSPPADVFASSSQAASSNCSTDPHRSDVNSLAQAMLLPVSIVNNSSVNAGSTNGHTLAASPLRPASSAPVLVQGMCLPAYGQRPVKQPKGKGSQATPLDSNALRSSTALTPTCCPPASHSINPSDGVEDDHDRAEWCNWLDQIRWQTVYFLSLQFVSNFVYMSVA
jgi:hypothetical protein